MLEREANKLRRLTDFESLVDYLRDELDWPVEAEDADDITFDYDPAELGLDPAHAVKIESVKQLRPLTDGQPWGIFYIQFETKRLPVVVLRRILHALIPHSRSRSVERPVWQMADLLFISTFGDSLTDQREIAFAHFHQEMGDLPTLRVLGWDGADTPLKLDHVAATLKQHLQWPVSTVDTGAWRQQWTSAFRHRLGHVIRTADALADRLAELARGIRDAALTLMAHESERGPLRRLHRAFQTALIHDLSEADFADTYAQTITYGLLTAAISRTEMSEGRYGTALVAENVTDMVPLTNPFLREMLQTFLQAGGRGGNGKVDRQGINFDELGIQDVVDLLRGDETDLPAILRDFGNRTRGEDPVIHFYEHFLSAYNKQLKVQRGVFYTPQPVVSYIVRSVHELLQTEFGLEDGLASTVTWGEMEKRVNHGDTEDTEKGKEKSQCAPCLGGERKTNHGDTEDTEKGKEKSQCSPCLGGDFKIPVGVDPQSPFVVVLDPATGTATFLVAVIDVIHGTLAAKWTRQGLTEAQQAAAWNDYVPRHLLPRLYGYELMMAPYAIAHMKIGLKLWETGYRFASAERVRVYLTNALEPAGDDDRQMAFDFAVPALAHEAQAVNAIKQNQRFTIIIGNPPYAGHSANDSAWVAGLLRGVDGAGRPVENYFEVDGGGLDERNPKWLNDDYVKFIRLGQWHAVETGAGILAFITNHGYLDNPTFRGMRQSLMADFDRIHVLDLHGSSKKKETTPEGGPDENVFDIMPGVAILLGVKKPHPRASSPLPPFQAVERGSGGEVFHADLHGLRGRKYTALAESDAARTAWTRLHPSMPFYLFAPQDVALRGEYLEGWKINDIMPVNSMGITTGRDAFATDYTQDELQKRLRILQSSQTDEQIRSQFEIHDSSSFSLKKARLWAKSEQAINSITPVGYRCFDKRYIIYSSAILARGREEVCQHQIDKHNFSLITFRAIRELPWFHVFISKYPIAKEYISSLDNCFTFPLYLYPNSERATLFDSPPTPAPGGRRPNLSPEFVRAVEERLGVGFRPHPLAPSPQSGEGEEPQLSPPSPQSGEGGRGVRSAPPQLWAQLKPLARQMRHEPTPAEDALWQRLRNRQVQGVKFRRQHALDRFIVDFYAAEPGLVIEVDGPIHDYTPEQDAIRQTYLESQGLRVLRFTNAQVLHTLSDVLTTINTALQSPPLQALAGCPGSEIASPPLQALEGCPGGEVVSPPLQVLERGSGGEVTPEDIFHYTYAILHSPTYRTRYAEFLKIDFPRLPLTSSLALFRALAALGADLVALHLLEDDYPAASWNQKPCEGLNPSQGSPRSPLQHPITQFVPGVNGTTVGAFGKSACYQDGRVYLDTAQRSDSSHFDGVPEAVWNFHIGGYQVLYKWLYDRRGSGGQPGRTLSEEDIAHYQRIVVALKETMRLMEEIDAVIEEYGGWPIE